MLVSIVIAVPLGTASAVYHNQPFDYFARVVSLAGLALPLFSLQTLVRNLVLPKYFDWLPPPGYAEIWEDPALNLQQVWLPILLLGFSQAAIPARLVRSSMLDVLREDYMRTARAKGLRNSVAVIRHGTRNALLPVMALAGLQLGALLGGTVITESIFGLPGIGRYVLDGIRNRDYPVIQTVVLLTATSYLGLNLVVDTLYAFVDPRISLRSAR